MSSKCVGIYMCIISQGSNGWYLILLFGYMGKCLQAWEFFRHF